MPGVLRQNVFLTAIAAILCIASLVWAAEVILAHRFKGDRKGRRRWSAFHRLLGARRNLLAIAIGCTVLLVRAALLPVWAVPVPSIPDEFSYLLMADTFASGRVANPPHPMWKHLETLFVLQQPTYASMYAPAQGLILAAGQRIGGDPWWGVWFSVGVMCSLLCWMLQQWLPPTWAAAGAVWAALQVGISTYWINSYWGGAPAAAGGALLLGAAARARRGITAANSLLIAGGLGLLAASRPYEGGVLGLCTMAWVIGVNRRRLRARTLWPGCLLLLACGSAMAYYCWRVTGSPFQLPQYLYMRQYAFTKAFIWQKPPAAPEVRHTVLRDALRSFAFEQQQFDHLRTALWFSFWKIERIASFYLGPLMLLPLITFPWLIRGRLRIPVLAMAATLAAVLLTIALQPHYCAPLTGFFYLVTVQSLRLLWAARRRGNWVGQFLVPAAPLVCLLTVILTATPPVSRAAHRARREIAESLARDGNKHLVIVQYAPTHNVADEWVYNAADPDRSPVVWARDMGASNQEIIQYYHDRKVWLLPADNNPIRLVPLGVAVFQR